MSEEIQKQDWNPREDYSRELGIGAPLTDADKRQADAIAEMPHVEGSTESKENLQEMQEANAADVAPFRLFDEAEVGDAALDERTGRVLHVSTFVQMLWKCGIVCVLTRMNTQGLHSLKGDAHAKDRAAQYQRTMAGLVINSVNAMPLPAPRYITWVQIPAMIEYSVMRFDAHGLATSEKFRGWRTVLLKLIQEGFLTERQANYVFGEPRGAAAARWQQILQSFRNAGAIAS